MSKNRRLTNSISVALAAILCVVVMCVGCSSRRSRSEEKQRDESKPEESTGGHFSKERQETRKRIRKNGYTGAVIGSKFHAQNKACQFRLSQLGKALVASSIVEGKFPASLQDLVAEGGVDESMIICPMDDVEYAYVGGQSLDADRENILVYEDGAAHEGKCHVLYISGVVDSLTPEELADALSRTKRANRR